MPSSNLVRPCAGSAFCLVLLLAATTVSCTRVERWYRLRGFDREIERASSAIEAAADGAARARAHTSRARIYSEKARLALFRGWATAEEGDAWVRNAFRDHDRAVELAPGDAEALFARGMSHYDRVPGTEADDPRHRATWEKAKADFGRALELDAKRVEAWERRGMVNTALGDFDGAISDFRRQRELDPKSGAPRLADAFCLRGMWHHREGRHHKAMDDYETAIHVGAPRDACACDPYLPLEALRSVKD